MVHTSTVGEEISEGWEDYRLESIKVCLLLDGSVWWEMWWWWWWKVNFKSEKVKQKVGKSVRKVRHVWEGIIWTCVCVKLVEWRNGRCGKPGRKWKCDKCLYSKLGAYLRLESKSGGSSGWLNVCVCVCMCVRRIMASTGTDRGYYRRQRGTALTRTGNVIARTLCVKKK